MLLGVTNTNSYNSGFNPEQDIQSEEEETGVTGNNQQQLTPDETVPPENSTNPEARETGGDQ